MRWLRARSTASPPTFDKGGRLERWHPLWEATDTFLYTPASVTKGGAHVRDALDLKRMMMLVVIADAAVRLHGAVQHRAAGEPRARSGSSWRRFPAGGTSVIRWLGVGYSPDERDSPASSTARCTSCRSTS